MKKALTILAVLAMVTTGAMAADSYSLVNDLTVSPEPGMSTTMSTDSGTPSVSLTGTSDSIPVGYGLTDPTATEYGQDFTVKSDFALDATNTELGVAARSHVDIYGSTTGYSFSLNPDNNYLTLLSIDGGPANIENLATYQLGSEEIDSSNFSIELSVSGTTDVELEGSLYGDDGLIKTLTATATNDYADGEAGLYMYRSAGSPTGTWTDPVIVPEPATMSLLGLGGIAALLRRRSRKA